MLAHDPDEILANIASHLNLLTFEIGAIRPDASVSRAGAQESGCAQCKGEETFH